MCIYFYYILECSHTLLLFWSMCSYEVNFQQLTWLGDAVYTPGDQALWAQIPCFPCFMVSMLHGCNLWRNYVDYTLDHSSLRCFRFYCYCVTVRLWLSGAGDWWKNSASWHWGRSSKQQGCFSAVLWNLWLVCTLTFSSSICYRMVFSAVYLWLSTWPRSHGVYVNLFF